MRDAFLQHPHKDQFIVRRSIAEPNDFHAGARCIEVPVNHTKIGVVRVERDAGFHTLYVQSQMSPLRFHSSSFFLLWPALHFPLLSNSTITSMKAAVPQ